MKRRRLCIPWQFNISKLKDGGSEQDIQVRIGRAKTVLRSQGEGRPNYRYSMPM